MIITISGKPGAGKSSVAKLVAKKLNLKHYSAGDMWRRLARKKKITILQLNQLAENNQQYDRELDKQVAELGKKQDDFIIDSRLAFHFIPDSIKIFLDCSLQTRAHRILKDTRIDEDNLTLADTINKIKKREQSEVKRYKQLYHVAMYDKKQFDLVLSTTHASIAEVTKKIIFFINKRDTFKNT